MLDAESRADDEDSASVTISGSPIVAQLRDIQRAHGYSSGGLRELSERTGEYNLVRDFSKPCTQGFDVANPANHIRANRVVVGGVRLPYFKFPRNPEIQ